MAGGSFLSVDDARFHFGLGPVDQVERVTVEWGDGSPTSLQDLEVNRSVRVQGAEAPASRSQQ